MARRSPGRDSRLAGVLLHPTSLPERYGCGDVGPLALRFLRFLRSSEQSAWQMLPITPPGRGFSPYDSASSFAGSRWLISPVALAADGLLTQGELRATRTPNGPLDPDAMMANKGRLLALAHHRSRSSASTASRSVGAFARRHSAWLGDYVLYEALAEVTGAPWTDWSRGLRDRDPKELRRARKELSEPIAQRTFEQWAFDRQWRAMRSEARRQRVHLIGDLPMFVAHDSADVWANRAAFDLDRVGRPRAVSGVPPDRFSRRGQCWDTPVFAWRRLQRDGFDYWRRRVCAAMRRFDTVRLDHFIGLTRYWRIPPEGDARTGRFVNVPGHELLLALRAELGELPFIVEDLGLVTPAVTKLKDRHELMGMGALPFGWDDERSEHAPPQVAKETVYYTSLHDTDTALGELDSLRLKRRARALQTLQLPTNAPRARQTAAILRTAYDTRARWVITPLQDAIGLDSRGRMNVPGTPDGNWRWRLDRMPTQGDAARLARLVRRFDRSCA